MKTGQDSTEDKLHYYFKFSIPFACLIFSILGVCVGLRPHRSSSAIGLGVSILIVIIYYILFSISMGLGLSKILNPVVAAWTPNMVIGIAGFILFKEVAYQ